MCPSAWGRWTAPQALSEEAHIGRLKGRLSGWETVRTLRFLLVCSIVVPPLAFAIGAYYVFESIHGHAKADLVRAAAVAEEHAAKAIELNQLVIERINDLLAPYDDDAIRAREPAFHQELVQAIKGLPQVKSAWILGGTGKLLVSAGIYPVDPNANLSQRPYFKTLMAGRRTIDISLIQGYTTHAFLVAVAGRRQEVANRFGGVVAVVVTPEYFRAFYKKLVNGSPDFTVELVRDDGAELVRYPVLEPAQPAQGVASLLMSAIAKTPQGGVVEGRAAADAATEILAYQRIGDFPVYATVSRTRASLVGEWASVIRDYFYFRVPVAIGVMLLCLMALRKAKSEAGALARAHEAMAQRDAAEMALRQSHKMEALGQLTGGVAHDFNNLLTIIIWNIEALRRRLPPELAEMARLADAAMEGARRAVILVRRLLAFSRRQPLEPKPIDPNRLVVGMSELLHRTLGEGITIETVLAGGIWRISADIAELESALLNLVINARDAMRKGGKLTIETANALLDEAYAAAHAEVTPGQYVAISVSDTGLGMTKEVAAKAFEPFFTTKDIGQGTGLGLSQVYGFIKQSGGHVQIMSEPGAGTTVTLYLPRLLAAAGEVTYPRAATAPVRPAPDETVLVVEDDAAVRAASLEMLRELGYRVLEAADGRAALRLLEAEPEVTLLFTDVGLPGGLNGRQLAREAQRRRAGLKVLFTTGYARDAILHQGRLEDGVALIVKPFTIADLGAKIQQLLASAVSTDA